MKRLLVACMAVVAAGCAGAMAEKEPLSGEASIKDAAGKEVGRAVLIQTAEGVRIAVTGYRGLPAGEKGVHIHEFGVCQPPEFTSAGGHFNPHGKQHGLANPAGPHAGDLPNMKVSAAGEGGIDHVSRLVTLEPGKPHSLFRDHGTSIVIHAAADDGKSDPAGNSGARIACGVITR